MIAWLRQHTGIEVIARDRGRVCTDGARRGAPDAIQVADRWHLLANLTDTLKRAVDRRWHDISGHLVEAISEELPDVEPDPVPVAEQPLTAIEWLSYDRRERRVARFEKVRYLHLEGMGVRELARTLGMARRTVRNFLRAEFFPERAAKSAHPTKLTPFMPYLRERWDAGCHNGMELWRELRIRGYTGSRSFVSYWVAKERKLLPPKSKCLPRMTQKRPKRPKRPTPRQVVWRLARPAEDLKPEEQLTVERVCAACPQLATAYSLVQSFGRMIRHRNSEELAAWLDAAEASGIVEMAGLAGGIRRDFAAVEAALVSKWSTGQVEGQNHRLKLLKRQMYGRAGFELLKKRVLNSA